MLVIAVMNQKGGVGKSTVTRNFGAFLALQGYRTLMIDVDAQSNLSQICNVPADVQSTVLDAFRNQVPQTYNVSPGLSIIPCSLSFAGIELEIIGAMQREMFLSKAIKKLPDDFDICLIDCPPAINIITTNALAASQWVLIPMEASLTAFNGLEMMFKIISMVRDGLNPDLSILGAFINKYKEKTVIAREILQTMEDIGVHIALFDSKVRQFEDFKKAEFAKKSIFEVANTSLAAADFRALGHEILDKLKANNSIR